MRKTVTYALCLIMGATLLSCARYNEKEATEYMRSHLKYPSTLNVVKTTTKEKKEETKYDTIFHIEKIYGDRYEYIDAYASIDSIVTDSVIICAKRYPKATVYSITFDARNETGATVRDSIRIYETKEGFMTAGEYHRTYGRRDCTKEEKKALRMTKYNNDHLASEGRWQKIYDL